MRAGTRNAVKRNPQVNLVPMMDVLMTVLTFFVILSMTLNGQQVADITIPGEIELEDTTSKESTVTPFLLGINAQGQLVHDNVIIKSSGLVKALQKYYAKNPDGQILLVADRTLSYNKVTQILKGLRAMGGKKVSLAIQPFESKE